MIKEFFMKRMMQRQMAGIPEAEQQKIFAAIEKNPELFSRIGTSLKEKMSQGKDQMTAAREAASEFQHELAHIMK